MKYNQQAAAPSPKELLSELQGLVVEAQSMVADSVSENSAEALEHLHERFSAAQERFIALCNQTKQTILAGAKNTDTRIRDNPYQSVAIALGVGVVVGLLAARRGR